MPDFRKNFSKKINWDEAVGKISTLAEKNIPGVFFLALIVFFVWGGLVWYRYVYRAEWNEAKKQEYSLSREKGVIFNKEAFEKAVEEKEMRKYEAQKEVGAPQDIFRLKPSAEVIR